MHPRWWAAAALGSALLMTTLMAEQGVLVVHVASVTGAPIQRVILSTQGDGGVGSPTDVAGRTRIRLGAQTRPQAIVALTVVKAPNDLVFISPWDNQVRVPPFENESQNFASVVLAERGDRALLENGKALVSIVSKLNLNAAARAPAEPTPAVRRGQALSEVAASFGLEAWQVDAAIRAWGEQTPDAYEKGMAHLYAQRFPQAVDSLATALRLREENFERGKRDAADAAFFLGQALYEQGNYGASVEAYRKALNYRPGDPATMNNLGLGLSLLGDYAGAEPFFRQTIAATELAKGNSDPELVFALNNLGGLLVSRGQPAAAEPLLRRGLMIRETALGPTDRRTANSLTNVASVLLLRGDDAGAEPLLLRARTIFEQPQFAAPFPPARPMEQRAVLGGPFLGRPGLGSVLLNLSTLELRRGRIAMAKALAEQALKAETDATGPRNLDTVNALTALARAELAAREYANAVTHFSNGVEIVQRTVGATHPSLADPLAGLGDAYAAQQNTTAAADAYRRAIMIRRTHFGPDDPIAAALTAKLPRP